MSQRWIRSHRAAVADAGDDLLLVASDGSVRRLEGDSAELARAVIGFVAQARTDAQVIAQIESLAGPLGDRRDVVVALLGLLADSGAITSVRDAAAPDETSARTSPATSTGGSAAGKAEGAQGTSATTSVHATQRLPGANIVVGVSGAIAATHAPALVSALQRRGHTVEVALTQTAQRFVSIDALRAIAGREIHTTMWPHTPHAPAPHVALAQWADLVIVYPASGTTVGRIANGDFSDLVSAIALTTRAPVVLAPSMNIAMLEAPAVQRNLEQLRANGAIVLHGIPSQEVAEAPSTRSTITGAAASPAEVAATIDALRAAGALPRRDPHTVTTPSTWDAVYRAAATGGTRADGLPLLPWASAECDPDIATDLAIQLSSHLAGLTELAPAEGSNPAPAAATGSAPARTAPAAATESAPARTAPAAANNAPATTAPAAASSGSPTAGSGSSTAGRRRPLLLDVGCGLGQVARHAASLGFRVVATDISEVALRIARDLAPGDLEITWLRDDICASNLIGEHDVIVDRATLHTLPRTRVHAWAASMRRLLSPSGRLLVKTHRDGIAGVTTGWTTTALRDLMAGFGFELVSDHAAELPGISSPAPIPSLLLVLRRT